MKEGTLSTGDLRSDDVMLIDCVSATACSTRFRRTSLLESRGKFGYLPGAEFETIRVRRLPSPARGTKRLHDHGRQVLGQQRE